MAVTSAELKNLAWYREMEKRGVFVRVKTTNPLNGSHQHWRMKQGPRKVIRAATRDACYRVKLKLGTVMVFTLTRFAPSDGLDDDSLPASMKSVRDGIADVLGINDRDKRVRWQYRQERAPQSCYGVLIQWEAGNG